MRLFSANTSLFLKSECSISCMCHFTDSLTGLLSNGDSSISIVTPMFNLRCSRSNAPVDEEGQEHEEADVISTGLRQT